MQPTLFGALVALVGIWCQFGSFRRTVIVMVALTVFGAVAALDLPALGGASVTPANFFLLFFLLRLVSMRNGTATLVAEIAPRRPLFVFLLLIIWIVGSAFLLPRLFEGATNVFSLSRSADNDGGTMPLHFTSGNLSQAVYAIGGFLVACATSAFARKKDGFEAILSAFVLVTSLNIGFGLLDLVTAATHTGFILDVIHTASYAFLTDDELGGLKRLSGSFSEASAFASYSLTLLGINFTLFVLNVRPRFTGIASLLLTAFVALSTSSAGYAGLVVFYGSFLAYALIIGLMMQKRRLVAVGFGTIAGGHLPRQHGHPFPALGFRHRAKGDHRQSLDQGHIRFRDRARLLERAGPPGLPGYPLARGRHRFDARIELRSCPAVEPWRDWLRSVRTAAYPPHRLARIAGSGTIGARHRLERADRYPRDAGAKPSGRHGL